MSTEEKRPERITYERWWTVYSSGHEPDFAKWADPEDALRDGLRRIRNGDVSVTIYRNDHPA